jgi:hypothetical protein
MKANLFWKLAHAKNMLLESQYSMLDSLRFRYICQTLDRLTQKYHAEIKFRNLHQEDDAALLGFISEVHEEADEIQVKETGEKLTNLQLKFQAGSEGRQRIGALIDILMVPKDSSINGLALA